MTQVVLLCARLSFLGTGLPTEKSIVDSTEKINEYRAFFTIHKLTTVYQVGYNEQMCDCLSFL